MSNCFGKCFRVMTWGESHGPAVGVVIDGFPSGFRIDGKALRSFIGRSRSSDELSTPRAEPNRFRILSGIFRGKTIGTPISLIIENRDAESAVYEDRKKLPRPGHADFTWAGRYEHVDWRGGGRSSGREAVARVAAGGLAVQLLKAFGITVHSSLLSLAGVSIDGDKALARARAKAVEIGRLGDSTGGRVKVWAKGLPLGLGEPVFGKLSSELASAMVGIGGVKSFGVGIGDAYADARGSEIHDAFHIEGDSVSTVTNNCGGLLGGISTGSDVWVTLAVKPTPSHHLPMETVDMDAMTETTLQLKGRYDVNFAPRVAVVAEAMMSMVLVDHMIRSGYIHPTKFHAS